MKTLVSLLVFAVSAASLSAQPISNYQQVVSSQNPTAYFKLDSTLESAVDTGVILESFAGGYTSDAFRTSSNCWYFVDQNTSYLRYTAAPLINGGGVANSNATAKGSVSFLFRALSGPNIGGQRFLFDATSTGGMGTTNHNAFSLCFENDTSTNSPNSVKLRFGDSTTTILEASNVLYGAWYYFALTYDEARVPNKAIWFLGPAGGSLSTGMTTNDGDAVAGEGTWLYIGQRADIKGAYRSPGSGRIDEFAIWNRELSSTEISNQFAKLPQPVAPGSSYAQVVESQFPKYFFKLDNSLVESVGNSLSLSTNGTGGAFTTDFLGNPNSAYSFSATNDALYITNDLIAGGGPGTDTTATGVGSITLLFRMLSDTNNEGQRFIFSAPGSEATATDDNQLGLFLESYTNSPAPSSLKLRLGNTTKGSIGSSWPDNNVPVAYPEELVPNAWYYFAMTYDESRNTPEVYVYFGRVGGTLTNSTMNPANNAVVGDNGWLVLGNKIQLGAITDNAFRNPGQGAIDAFAIWHDELNPAEIRAQFDALSPAAPPSLNIALNGSNVVLSWTATGTAAYQLVAAPDVTSTVWTGAGTPTVINGVNYVTNGLSGTGQYYRLKKQ